MNSNLNKIFTRHALALAMVTTVAVFPRMREFRMSFIHKAGIGSAIKMIHKLLRMIG